MRLDVVAEVLTGAERRLQRGPELVPIQRVTGFEQAIIEGAEEGVVDAGGADAAGGDHLRAAATGDDVLNVGHASAAAEEDEAGIVGEEFARGVEVVIVASVDQHGGARGGDRGLRTGDVGVDFDAALLSAATGEEDAIGGALEGPIGGVGVGGEEAGEGLDAVVVVVEDVALHAEAVGEEIGNVEGGAGGLAERFKDAAEGCRRKGGINVGRGGGQDHGGFNGFGERVLGVVDTRECAEDYGSGHREGAAGFGQKRKGAAERGDVGTGVPRVLSQQAQGGFAFVLRLRASGQAQRFGGAHRLGWILSELEQKEIGRGHFGGAPGRVTNGGAIGELNVLAHFAKRGCGMARGGGDEELFRQRGLRGYGVPGNIERLCKMDRRQPVGSDHVWQKGGGRLRIRTRKRQIGIPAHALAQDGLAQERRFFERQPRRQFHQLLGLFKQRRLNSNRWRGRQGRHIPSLCDTFGFVVLNKKILDKFRVAPGRKFKLKSIDPGWRGDKEMRDLSDAELKHSAEKVLEENLQELAGQQAKLYADDRWSVLVVLQAMDAAGKDGMVKHVTSGLNPQGCDVYSFKAPSTEELDHSYLWRIMRVSPARGKITIFNRSHYEEVLVVKVHPEYLKKQKLPAPLVTKKIWEERYEDINNFEKHMARNGTIILKFFLHVSRDEQKKRFLERLEDPEKHWKFSAQDLNERQYWNDYMRAYEEALEATSTKWAPWYVIPADNKAVARVLVSNILTRAMEELNLEFPVVSKEEKLALEEAHKRLVSE